jgi:hypothetical protein
MSGLCAQISDRAAEVARAITDRAQNEQERYDAETRHGLTQGTGFGPGRVSVSPPRAGVRPDLAGITPDSLRAVFAGQRASAESAAVLVQRLLVAPESLSLRVGDSLPSLDLFRRLDVRGVTTAGDTLLLFARTFRLEPSTLVERVGRMIVARHAGETALWVVAGTDIDQAIHASTRAVRVPIHIR